MHKGCPVCQSNPEAAVLLHKGPCDDCGSSDACAVYADDHTHCYSCGRHRHSKGEAHTRSAPKVTDRGNTELVDYEVVDLGKRKINEETCRHWQYGVGTFRGKPVQVANYCNEEGQVVAQKLRFPNKDFLVRGDAKQMGLYGQWKWRDGGRRVVVTEGEIDALTISQLQKNKWPVVSVPNGAQGAAKAVSKQIEWLEKFDEVVFAFDMDKAGREAATECALLLSPGKAKIAHLPRKDANECLVRGEGEAVVSAMWGAKTYRPDGVIDSEGAMALLKSRQFAKPIMSYPFPKLEEMTKGILPRQVITVCSGSGMGKTEFTRELEYSALAQGLKIGCVRLEESVDRSLVGLVGVHLNKRLHLEDEPQNVEGFTEAYDEIIKGRVFFYDHFGSMDGDELIAKLKYMRVACGVDLIVLDHISIVVSGMEEGDERRTIDNLMTRLRSLAEETGVAIVVVSHLKRPQGTPHEEGGRTSLAQLRGSGAIGHLSDIGIGLERDQQAEGDEANTTTIRLLKNRRTGETGVAGHAFYDKDTGRMTASECAEFRAAASAAGGDF